MAKRQTSKQKRSSLLVAGLLSFGLAGLSLFVGFYVGFMTMNYNYITIGTMNRGVMYLFVCTGLFIALGVTGVSVGLKLLSLSKSTNFVFYTKKGVATSAMVLYAVLALVGVLSIVFGFMALQGSGYAGMVFFLAGVAVALSVLCFVFVFKETRAFMKKIKNGEVVIEIEYPRRFVPATEVGFQAYAKEKYSAPKMDIESFQRELLRLDEMRGQGLINDQEYQSLKKHYIDKINNKLF